MIQKMWYQKVFHLECYTIWKLRFGEPIPMVSNPFSVAIYSTRAICISVHLSKPLKFNLGLSTVIQSVHHSDHQGILGCIKK